MGLADTRAESRRVQLEVYRGMSPERRVDVALAMSEDARRVTLEGIRLRCDRLDDEGVRRELLRVMLGAALAGAVSGVRPVR
ncbi:MAG: hypothetical protein ACRD0O_09625 [Acidimicrobiia bacterium]